MQLTVGPLRIDDVEAQPEGITLQQGTQFVLAPRLHDLGADHAELQCAEQFAERLVGFEKLECELIQQHPVLIYVEHQ